MSSPDEQSTELRRIRRLLDEIHDVAEDASLTGALADGAPAAIARYTAVLNRLIEMGVLTPGTFDPIPEGAGFGHLGIEAKLLASYVRDERHSGRRDDEAETHAGAPDFGTLIALAPFMDRADLTELVRNTLRSSGRLDPGALVALAPFVDDGEIGQIAREHMSDWFRPPSPTAPPAPPEPPSPPTPPEPPSPGAPAPPMTTAPPHAPTSTQMQEISERIRDAASRLSAATDADERSALAEEMAALAAKQAHLAQELTAQH